MAEFRIKIDGLQKLQVRLKNLRPDAEAILAQEIEVSANAIELDAKQNAPNGLQTSYGGNDPNYGQVRNAISAWSVSKLTWNVGISTLGPINDLAAYQEFGTGKWIDIPAGMEAYAMQWYKNGRGTILPQPFLFPAGERERVNLRERLKADLLKL